MFYDIYTRSQIAIRYYEKKGKTYDAKQANDRIKQDKNLDFKLLNEVIDEGYAIQKSMLKEAKKRKK